jgi:hypothetical protein
MFLMMLPAATIAASMPPDLGLAGAPPPKSHSTTNLWTPPKQVLAGGDDIAHAVVIPSLPYTDSGNTCGFNNDYAFPCPGDPSGSPAPDVVYSFTPASNVCVNISLCGSNFDTGLYVYQNTAGNTFACNDDACGPTAQQSRLAGLQLTAGNTYYIIVDAYAGCGDYSLSISECLPPCNPLACPSGATPEGEQTCADLYVDHTNGGCNSTPPVYEPITLPATICGTYGKFCADLPFCFNVNRDTDWYQVTLASATTVHICVQGEANTQLDVLDASGGCTPGTLVPNSLGFPLACERFCEDLALATGTYWIFVAPTADNTFPPCGSRYVLSVTNAALGVEEGPLRAIELDQSVPNPALGGSTSIRFALPQATSIRLAIYNLAGERVRTLVTGPQGAGSRTVIWDGRNDRGQAVSNGVYFYKLMAGSFSATRSIVLLK